VCVLSQLLGRRSVAGDIKLCVHASFFDKNAPAAKKATNCDCQGMLKVIQHALMVAKL
jgi:hypothetical protein